MVRQTLLHGQCQHIPVYTSGLDNRLLQWKHLNLKWYKFYLSSLKFKQAKAHIKHQSIYPSIILWHLPNTIYSEFFIFLFSVSIYLSIYLSMSTLHHLLERESLIFSPSCIMRRGLLEHMPCTPTLMSAQNLPLQEEALLHINSLVSCVEVRGQRSKTNYHLMTLLWYCISHQVSLKSWQCRRHWLTLALMESQGGHNAG